MVEAASSDEDPGQVQDELRRVRLRSADARCAQPAQRLGRFGGHVKASGSCVCVCVCTRVRGGGEVCVSRNKSFSVHFMSVISCNVASALLLNSNKPHTGALSCTPVLL